MAKLTNTLTKSFVKGLTSFMIIWPGPIAAQCNSPMTDAKKIASDWKAVGNDIRLACNKYGREYEKRKRTGWG